MAGAPTVGVGSQFVIFNANPTTMNSPSIPAGLGQGQMLNTSVQVPNAVTLSGRYPRRVETILHFAGQPDVTRSTVGMTPVVVRDTSAFGAGRSFNLQDQLIRYPADPGKTEMGRLRRYVSR